VAGAFPRGAALVREHRDGRRPPPLHHRLVDVSGDILHLRYTSNVSDAHGHGPLEAGAGRLVAAQMLSRYATGIAASGGIPSSILEHPETLDAEQANLLREQWVTARLSSIGEPAVLSGGVTWKATQLNPRDMALLELSQWNESRIALMLGVPPHLISCRPATR
jgi:HK97 family phage portal protein